MPNKFGFSALKRKEILNEIVSKESDLLIIGGGITGAGIALDAVTRNLSVTLIEKSDFTFGTSSRSTKLVHGGLRYLEQFEFNLVRKVGKERSILYKNASHLVIPQKMLLPIVKGGKLNKLGTLIGLTIYDFLAGVTKKERRKMLGRKKTLKQEPLLQDKIIKGGAIYYEYTTNDARLTIEILKKAAEKGVLAINYLEAKNFIYKNGVVIGMEVRDVKSKKSYNIFAKSIINATGPWLDEVRNLDDSLNKKKLFLTKGVHICIDHKKLPLNQAVYFDTQDKRMIFTIPKNNYTYIGTTDTSFNKDIDNPKVTREDINYLLNSVNRVFRVEISESDITSSWSGLRPLIYKGEKNPSEISRKDEIFISKSGLISIAGGKLTGYRLMAKKAVDTLLRKNRKFRGRKYVKSQTKNILLSGGGFFLHRDMEKTCRQNFKILGDILISYENFRRLFFRYGANTELIIKKINEFNYDKVKNPIIKAEIRYNIHFEMLSTVSDYFMHRSDILYFEPELINDLLDDVADEMSCLLKWSDSEKEKQKKEFLKIYNNCLTFQ